MNWLCVLVACVMLGSLVRAVPQGTSASISQRALGRRVSIPHNRVHVLVHELEDRGLVERRGMPGDLRAHALRLTVRGDHALSTAADRVVGFRWPE